VAGCQFAVAAFTNLTQDHLDFHGTMDAYRDAKTLLFRRHLAPGGHAVLNLGDPAAPAFERAAREAGAKLWRVSRDAASGAEVALETADVHLDGTRARLRLPSGPLEVALPLVGDFNLENLLVASGVAAAAGAAPEAIAAGAAACPQVPGRVERIRGDGSDEPTVLVDYAHTPDAVEKVLRTLRPLTPGRLITVFGCGGDRDRGKRPLMAQAAARWSDRIVATSDNPRTEDPAAILADVERGLEPGRRVAAERLAQAQGGYTVLVDRREAIGLAVAIARPGDTVLIAGKGHEDYQIVGREKFPFSDPDEARRALQARRARSEPKASEGGPPPGGRRVQA
jgi:UDP-N-acetylmuramoyl-L-alanyl-D-glutamate--2,6-diaminopimelate ligase